EAVGGSQSTLNQACELLAPMGTVLVLGAFDPGFEGLQPASPLSKEAAIIFSNCYGFSKGKHDFEIAIQVLISNRSALAALITHEFGINDASMAFMIADDKSNHSVKVQLEF